VVAQPLRRAETLALYSGSCVAPLRLGGLRGKQSTPSVWLGGTGEPSAVGERERQGARVAARSAGRRQWKAKGNGMVLICEV
jgi:hypothetical protein